MKYTLLFSIIYIVLSFSFSNNTALAFQPIQQRKVYPNKYKFKEQPIKIYSSSHSALEEFIQTLQSAQERNLNHHTKNQKKYSQLSSRRLGASFSRWKNVLDSASQEWTTVYNPKLIPTEDGVSALKVDEYGNSYLTGVTDSAILGKTFFTCKLDSANNIVWSSLYHSPVKAVEGSTDLCIDAQKNVYVVGYSYKREYQSDIILLKYDGNGNLLWVKTYGDDDRSFDFPNALTVDGNGNVYVAGLRYVYVIGVPSGALILKFDSDGNLLKEIVYPGHQNRGAGIGFIHVSEGGNIYVAGATYDTLTSDDYLVMKYDSTGAQLWMQYYNGPGSNYDIIRAMKVDELENIIVTGEGWNLSTVDCATIKYDLNGNKLWLKRFSPTLGSGMYPNDMAIDKDGNIYVTGFYPVNIDGSVDCVVFKYNSAGALQWQSTFPDEGFRQNIGRVIRLDDSNRIYVAMNHTGYAAVIFSYLLQYSPSGILQSTIPFDSSYFGMLEINSQGKIHIAGTKQDSKSGQDIKMVSYEPKVDKYVQNQVNVGWMSSNYAVSLLKDPLDNIIVVANTGTLQGSDISVVKYNLDGQTIWSQRYHDGPFSCPVKAVTDHKGNIYVLAQSSNYATGENDFLTLKYNSDGVLEWTQKYSSATRYSQDFSQTLNVDVDGNVYVAGRIQDSIEHSTSVLIKYDNLGNQQWISYYEGEANTRNIPNVLHIDRRGNIYLAGSSEIVFGSGGEFLTIKYDKNGVQQWVRTYHGNGFGYNYINGIGIDDDFNVYITGLVTDSTGSTFTTLKYDSSASILWEAKADITNRRFNEAPVGLFLSKQGEIFVAGSVLDNEFGYQFIVFKYDSAGNEIWVSEIDSSGEVHDDYATAFTINETGNTFVTGYRNRNIHGYKSDYLTIRYDNKGKRTWSALYESATFPYNEPVGIVTDADGNCYVAGSSYDNNTYTSEVTTIKYSQITLDVAPSHNLIPHTYFLSHNYPNPFNPSTVIRYQVPVKSYVTLKVYNVLGQEVGTVVNEVQDAGYKSAEFHASRLPSGVYYYRMTAVGQDGILSYTDVKKMLLLK